MAPRVRPIGAAALAIGTVRHRLEESVWSIDRGARWLLRRDLRRLYRYRTSNSTPALAASEFSVFSQNGEDGIIEYLTRLMNVAPGVFAEIGAADGGENCTRLLAEREWKGVWIESDPDLAAAARSLWSDGRVQVVHSRVEPENVVGLLRNAGSPTDLDVLSIDIDSGNFQVTERVLEEFSPRLLVVEVNGEHRWEWIQTRGTKEPWDRSWNYGASLGAYTRLAKSRGYRLVGCDSAGVNAFFVRADMVRRGMVVGEWRDHYVPPSHRPGTAGQPRLSVESPRSDAAISEKELALVRFEDVELIGSCVRRRGDLVNVLFTIVNGSSRVFGAVGVYPFQLAGRVFDADGNEVGGQNPRRSTLAKVIPSTARSPASIEIQLPEQPGLVTVVPTIVQEDVAWRPARLAEGVRVTVV